MTPHPPSPVPPKSGIRPGVLLLILVVGMSSVVILLKFLVVQHPEPKAANPPVSTALPAEAPPPAPLPARRLEIPSRPAAAIPDPATDKLIATLFDESLPLQTRRQAARALARLGTDAAMAALKSALAQDTPAYLKAAIAEGLGECPHPDAGALLADLAGNRDEIVARGAVRGLGLRGGEAAVKQLGGLLFAGETPLSVRTEVALALGDVEDAAATGLLIRAAGEIQDETVLEDVLAGLGKKPFANTEKFFSEFLASPDTSVESKVAALEALGDNEGEVSPFLLKYLGDGDSELRAAAAWALTLAGGECGPQLTAALGKEPDASVRTSLYQALNSQVDADVNTILPLVQNEPDPSARLAGLAFLAGNLDSENAPAASDYFRQTAISELEKTAFESTNPQNRLAAVLALKQAEIPEATAALRSIAQSSPDRRVAAAARPPAPPPPPANR